jgi:hypothetical protein
MAHDDQAERALAAAVRSHQGMRFAALDRQIDAAQDRLAFDGDVEVFDLEGVGRHWSLVVGHWSLVI